MQYFAAGRRQETADFQTFPSTATTLCLHRGKHLSRG